jgi:hypothetical protein
MLHHIAKMLLGVGAGLPHPLYFCIQLALYIALLLPIAFGTDALARWLLGMEPICPIRPIIGANKKNSLIGRFFN